VRGYLWPRHWLARAQQRGLYSMSGTRGRPACKRIQQRTTDTAPWVAHRSSPLTRISQTVPGVDTEGQVANVTAVLRRLLATPVTVLADHS